jgi:hypothetical protein
MIARIVPVDVPPFLDSAPLPAYGTDNVRTNVEVNG